MKEEDDEQAVQAASNPHFGTTKLYDVLWTHSDNMKDTFYSNDFFKKVTLDTGCLKNVAGKKWLNGHMETLPPETITQVKKYPSSARFRFGSEDVRDSLGVYHIPCHVAGKDVILQVDIITSDIPCLISKATMKRAGGKINLKDDTIELFGKTVQMDTAPSGHYTLPISDIKEKDKITSEVFMAKNMENPAYDEAQLKKIHQALGHPSRQAFTNTLRAAKIDIPDLNGLLDKIYEKCLTCLQFHKAHVKPKVSLPLANDFNDTICLDLKIWPKYNKIIFYIIDAFTRFCQSHVIPDKTPESVIEKLMDNWIMNLYGTPKNILTDCGGEFYNSKFKDMAQNLNIRLYSTAAESPYQNGICERNHSVTDRIVEKMLTDDPSMTLGGELSAATFAKNALINVNSFSPIQLVTGKAPRLPNVMDNLLPAQEAVSSVKMYSDRANAIFSGRKIFMELENSKRINEALKPKIISPTVVYKIGDQVNYRKEGKDTPWQGPAEVVGIKNHGKVIFISHGRFVYSTSQSRLIKIPKDKVTEVQTSTSINTKTDKRHPVMIDSDSDSDDEDNMPPVNPAHDNLPPPDNLTQPPTPPRPPPPPPPPLIQEQSPIQNVPSRQQDLIPTPPPEYPDLNPKIDDNDISPDHTLEEERPEIDAAMATRGTAIKKKGKKPPYPKKGEIIFFRIKSCNKYSKIHPTLVEKYGQEWVKAKVMAKVYDNS